MRMVVVASRDIAPGEEVTLSYTPPLTSTPVRQVLFVCGQAGLYKYGFDYIYLVFVFLDA